MPGYDLHPGVDADGNLPELVRQALVVSPEMQAALTELYGDATNRDNHTGTQEASTISDFDSVVRGTAASTTEKGTAERATDSETQAMTDVERFITPANLAAASVSAKTADRIIRRDANGRARVETPAHADDISNRGYVDTRGLAAYPAFYVKYTTVLSKSGTTSFVVVPWNDVLLNNGSFFDVATYKFVAPIKGIYAFTTQLTNNVASSGGAQFDWYKNGAQYKIATIAYTATTGYQGTHGSLEILLDVNDTIELRYANNNNSTIGVDGTRSSFGGHLVAVVP